MNITKALEFLYSMGEKAVLTVLTPVWVVLCIVVGIPYGLINSFFRFCSQKAAAASEKLTELKSRLRKPVVESAEVSESPEVATA